MTPNKLSFLQGNFKENPGDLQAGQTEKHARLREPNMKHLDRIMQKVMK
jgi:hypothetical protein